MKQNRTEKMCQLSNLPGINVTCVSVSDQSRASDRTDERERTVAFTGYGLK